ncbi:MAG: DUF3793 family protein [Erysipelotrichaceae bacterium]|nr:DUF3793 family protein [Erysipelotrichaceae bacterium]
MSSTELQFEKLLAIHCAPVIKKKKVANMFHIEKSYLYNLNSLVNKYNQVLNPEGLFIQVLQTSQPRVTIFVYYKELLNSILHQYDIQEFLENYHYPIDNLNKTLSYLNYRLTYYKYYPHEIGLFLGYPLEDVMGFMNHDKCQYCGYWKVYHNEKNTKHLFYIYDLCQQEVLSCLHCGQCIKDIVTKL